MTESSYLAWQRSRAHRIRCLKLALIELRSALDTIGLLCWELLTWKGR